MSYHDGTTTISLKSLCIERSVFNMLGYFLPEYKSLCFQEYLWRYLTQHQKIKSVYKTLDYLFQGKFPTIRILKKVLLHEEPLPVESDEEELVKQYNIFHNDIQYIHTNTHLQLCLFVNGNIS